MSSMRVQIRNTVVKTGTSAKTNKPYFYIEVMQPQRRFIKPDNTKVEMALASLAETGLPTDLNLELQGDNLFAPENFLED